MKEVRLEPDPHLMESMRAVGYTLATAIADVIDNSITAKAHHVDVFFGAHPEPYIALLDDGDGMSVTELHEAMRLAARSPLSKRSTGDLGRFGLGLKTASLSQCRTLTVISKQAQEIHGARWSLDHLAATGEWGLLTFGIEEARDVPCLDDLMDLDSGTLVVWTNLDQIHAPEELLERELDAKMAEVRDHLALVFHRFTGAKTAPLEEPLTLQINRVPVPSVDPFLEGHRGTQRGPVERLTVQGVHITVEPFTLPYLNKMSSADRTRAQVSGRLRDSQGFYIYRAGRLVIWGTWFRIVPKDELGKLARAKVDIPNTLDHLWALDIKKSTASPPPEVRTVLKRLTDKIVAPSKRTHVYRGRNATQDELTRIWNLIDARGNFRYEINRSHPALVAAAENLDPVEQRAFEQVLRSIEASFPVEDAYNRLSGDSVYTAPEVDEEGVRETLRLLAANTQLSPSALAAQLASVEPFSSIRNLESYIESALNE